MDNNIEDLRLKAADNGGGIICYTQKEKTGADTYSGFESFWKEEAFNNIDDAVVRFKELAGMESNAASETPTAE